jgi:lipopolysaccharide export system permease protein
MLKKIDRYVLAECTWASLGVIAVLSVILVGNTLTRVLGDIAKGKLPAEALWSMMGVNLVHYLVVLIPMGVYLGVLLGMGRFYRDSEMAAMFACGIGIRRLYRPIGMLAVPAAGVTLLLSFLLAPWTAGLQDSIRHRAEQSAELTGLVAGQFNTSGRQTLFFERKGAQGRRMEEVFLHSRDSQRPTVQAAASADVQQLEQHTYVVFRDGRAYSGRPGEADYRLVEFARHGVQIERDSAPAASLRTSATPTRQLLGADAPRLQAELHWRAAVPIACLLLGLLALPLSHSAPRQGRFAKIGVGILVYIIYFNMLGLGRAWLERASVPAGLGLWWVHGLILLAVVVLVMKQERRGPFAGRGA